MKRVYNFSPGPSVLPLPVLEKAAAEMTDTNGTGQSVMEMSHRSKDFRPIIEKAEALFRELMGIPSNYKVLFLQGGASLQFSMIPLNRAAGVGGRGPQKRRPPILKPASGRKRPPTKRRNTPGPSPGQVPKTGPIPTSRRPRLRNRGTPIIISP
jgi:hypothetical protein